MSQRRRISRNAPCPCGSGRKYKHCCISKGFDWVEGSCEPGPDDLLFPNAPPAEQIEHQVVEAMRRAGLDPALIHAFEKTGLLVTEENQHLIPEKDLQEWADAIADYNRRHNPPRFPLATVALYGPDDRTTTKMAVGIFLREDAKPIVRRWVSTRVLEDPRIQQEILEFLREHGAATVVQHPGNLGCPHEEGEDFPVGQDCPFCPFWKGKQGSNRRV